MEEAYTTENWLVRIYRVKKPTNTNAIKYTERWVAAAFWRENNFFEFRKGP